jgi:2-hydroxychromene-2-carboxylate isomerase
MCVGREMMTMPYDKLEPLASKSPLIVYVGYKSPYAYLAMEPTYALEDELGIEIDWRPFTLDIGSYLGSARLGHEGKVVENERSTGQSAKGKYAYHDVRRYGSMRGRIIRGAVKMWDSSIPVIGMLWAREQGRAVLRAYSSGVFERFWRRELNLEDAGEIERVLVEAGAGLSGEDDRGARQVKTLYIEPGGPWEISRRPPSRAR